MKPCGALALALAFGCSGEPFLYAPETTAQAGSGLGGFVPSSSAGVGGVSAVSGSEPIAGSQPQPGDAGALAGAGGEPTQGEPSVCGSLRAGEPQLWDAEVCFEPSQFVMGSDTGSLGSGYTLHSPEHSVQLAAFALDRYEVTVARYRRCLEDAVCSVPGTQAAQGCTYSEREGNQESLPITCVSHSQAVAFCAWDNGRVLPTEAQWERAARGVSGRTYPWGNSFDCSRAVVSGNAQCSQWEGTLPQPVGSAPTGESLEGVFDLVGNAAEWVSDWSGRYPSGSQQDPIGPATGSTKVQRGGGWLTLAVHAVAYARSAVSPEASGPFGFRCARTP